MAPYLLVLAMAVTHYCGPLPPDMQRAVDAAMAALTPDERWSYDHESWKHAVFRASSNWENAMPSIREQLHKMHDQECWQATEQIRAGIRK